MLARLLRPKHVASAHLLHSTLAIGNALLPFLTLMAMAAFAGPILMGGWLFSTSGVGHSMV